jgi:hypothetical protein
MTTTKRANIKKYGAPHAKIESVFNKALVRDDGTDCPKGAVEVDIFTVTPDGSEIKKSKIYTEAAVPEMPKR